MNDPGHPGSDDVPIPRGFRPASARIKHYVSPAVEIVQHPLPFLGEIVREFQRNHGLLLAGAVAYYMLLSIVPLLILMIVVLSHVLDPAALMASLASHGLSAKLRAGGITADRFPTTREAARFLVRARDAGVVVKATAGLHHAIRGEYRLTYVAESDAGTMHGFVNLVLAATLLMTGKIDEELADACLDPPGTGDTVRARVADVVLQADTLRAGPFCGRP